MVLYTIALIVHVVICIALVLVILAQTSKGGLDASLGGAAMNVFGGSGASKFLRKWTQIIAVIFVFSCVFMVYQVKNVAKGGAPKIMEAKFGETQKPATKPAAPAASKTADKAANPAEKTTK